MQAGYQLYGARASFYTQKAAVMLAAMQLPHEVLHKTAENGADIELAAGGYDKVPVLRTPCDDWVTDSTQIGLHLDTEHPEAAILPTDPVMRCAALIADDWADEWLLRAALHWRVTDADNRRWTARHVAANLSGDDDPGEDPGSAYDHPAVAYISDFWARVGGVNRNGPEYREEILGLLTRTADALSAHFEQRPFLLGSRVSLPDFAIFGMLEAGLLWEPSAKAFFEPRWPAMAAYRERVRSAHAGTGEWDSAATAPETLARVFDALGSDFAPFLTANAAATAAGEKEARWGDVTMRARGFTEKCRQATGADIAALTADQRTALRSVVGADLLAAYWAADTLSD